MIWSFEVLMSNYSFSFCANKSDVFAVMFEDSKIGRSFCQGSAKILCNIFVGLAPYVKNLLQESKISFSLF